LLPGPFFSEVGSGHDSAFANDAREADGDAIGSRERLNEVTKRRDECVGREGVVRLGSYPFGDHLADCVKHGRLDARPTDVDRQREGGAREWQRFRSRRRSRP